MRNLDSLIASGSCKVVSKDVSDEFFKYIYSDFKWEASGFSIDWTNVEESICIDCSAFSFEEVVNTLKVSLLKEYEMLCFAYMSNEGPVICDKNVAFENISDFLKGPGDAYIFGVAKNNKYIYTDFVEIYSGNWICWKEKTG